MNYVKKSFLGASLAIALAIPASCTDYEYDYSNVNSYQSANSYSGMTTRSLYRDICIMDDLETWTNDSDFDRITIRPFTEDDRSWALEAGVEAYMKIYDNATYFVSKEFVPEQYQKNSNESDYILLKPKDYDLKEDTLINEGNDLIDIYMENENQTFHPIVLQFDGEDIAALFYRLHENSVLAVDEFLALDMDEERKYFVFGDIYKSILRKLEPDYLTHKICARHVNANKLSFFTSAGYTLDTAEESAKYWYDSMLFTGLSKTYT